LNGENAYRRDPEKRGLHELAQKTKTAARNGPREKVSIRKEWAHSGHEEKEEVWGAFLILSFGNPSFSNGA